jgi:rare lipoprotein A
MSNLRPIAIIAAASFLIVGCGEKKRSVRRLPPAPPISSPSSRPEVPPTVANDRRPALYVEQGLASWYGPPYHSRKTATGEIYDMHQMTAAHKTLPLNSVVRVTNVANGRSAVVRINDRGPFIGTRIIDLSLAAAKQIDVWRAGVAKVRVEVLETPSPINEGGRWCVQIGAFSDQDEATQLKQKLARRYSTARVIQFTGPTGEWVRFRAQNDDKSKAVEVARNTHVNEGGVFLVRLD